MGRAEKIPGLLVLALSLALGCAPIDVNSEVTLHPRNGPVEVFGVEQLARRDFVVEYVQLGPRLLVELREHRSCVVARHVPVMRVEEIRRTTRGFVIWDFALGAFTAGFAALAFAQPRLFSDRLVDGMGRVVYDTSSAYIVGGVFAAISAGLLAAGIVDGLRARDETRYAAAFEVELGAEHPCGGDEEGSIAAQRSLRLLVGDAELEAQTDADGRARFELLGLDEGLAATADGRLPVVLELVRAGDAEPTVVVLSLRVPFEAMLDAHTGVADTRLAPSEPGVDLGPVEGPSPP